MAYICMLIVLKGVISVALKPSFRRGKENVLEANVFPHLHFPGLPASTHMFRTQRQQAGKSLGQGSANCSLQVTSVPHTSAHHICGNRSQHVSSAAAFSHHPEGQ